MTTGTSRALLGGIILIVLALGVLLYMKGGTVQTITSFEECKAAGYPIMESFPEQCRTPDGKLFVNTVATTTPSSSSDTIPGTSGNATTREIRNVSVTPNQIVTSSLTVTGEAAGWYFEASFPVELVDGNGKPLAAGPAQAQGDWMTASFVPFVAKLTFTRPSTATGTLILRNDNPSGLPETQRELRIPVRFSTTERTVKLFYYDGRLDTDVNGNILCSSKGLVAVNRTIPVTQTPLQDTLRLLLRGELTSEERARGVTTEFPLPQVSLTSASLASSGALRIAIADPLNRTSGGACRAQVLRAQVEATARQFENVTSVSFTPETLFQP